MMTKSIFAHFKRSMTALLCLLIISSTVCLPVSAAVNNQLPDSSVVSSEKSEIASVGGLISDASQNISVNGYIEGSEPVKTVTTGFTYVRESIPRYNVRYLIFHEESGNIMTYSATEPQKPADSIVHNQSGDAADAYYFATDAEGNIDENTIIIDHSYRDQALWLLRQNKEESYGTSDIKDYDELSYWANIANNNPANPFLGNDKRYHHTYFFKGNGPEWNENGTLKTANNGVYWHSVIGQDADEAGVQERFLRLYDTHELLFGTSTVNTQIENLDDGSFLIFRRDTSTDPDTYYMLTCGSDGIWKTDVVTGLDETTIEDYKLSLYRYYSNDEVKYVNFKGYQNYEVLAGTTKEQVMDTIAQNISVMNVTNKNLHILSSGDTRRAGDYWLDFSQEYDSSADRACSLYNVRINYCNDDGSDTFVGAVTVKVCDELVISGTSTINNLAGLSTQNTTEGYVVQQIINYENVDCTFTVDVKTPEGVVTKTVPISIGMLTDANGRAVSTASNGVIKNLTLTYMGEVITNNFTLTIDDTDEALNYPVYPEEGAVNVTKTGNAVGKFNETGVANINLTTTGIPQNKGVDMIVVMDLSGSMSYGVSNTTRVDETNKETSRLFALQESLKAMINTLKASDVDYRIAMSDFGDIDSFEIEGAVLDDTNPAKYFFDVDLDGYWDTKSAWQYGTRREFFNHLNYVHGQYGEDYVDKNGNTVDLDNRAMPYNVHYTKYERANLKYTGKIVPNIYTGSHTVNADAFVNVDTFDETAIQNLLNDVELHQDNSLGTNYDVGLEYAYQLGHAIQEKNIAEGEDRDIICVFMSDGAAMQYNYFTGRTFNQAWGDWLTGDIEYDSYQHKDGYQISDSPELVEIMSDLLNKFKNGTLKNPKYGVRETIFNTSGERNKNNATELLAAKQGEGEDTNLYFDFSAVDISAAETFSQAMDQIGVGLHWELLDRIAKANGLSKYVSANEIDADLLALAKAGTLIYPNDEPEFYPQYTGESTDFLTAMKEIGVDCNWELFAQIAIDNVGDSRLDTVYGELTTLGENMKWGTLSPYYYFYNEDGKNWFAEAIKGKRDTLYPVVNKYAKTNNTDTAFEYYGDIRNNFDTETGLALDGKDYISGFRGLNIPIYTVGLSLCTEVYLTEQIAKDVLVNISSGPSYAFTANNKEELIDVFNTIGTSSSVAATGAYFTDKMGPEFDLYTRKTVTNEAGETVTINVEPVIKVLEYNLDANHERTGAPIVYETVTIKEDSNGKLFVTSDKLYNTIIDSSDNLVNEYYNIFSDDGIIKAKYFYYNTNKYVDENNTGTRGIDLTGDGNPDWQLEAETFFWIIGPIGNTERVLDYQVYLTGSMEGQRELGVYETNTGATLKYNNYLGNNCSKDTVSPAFPWPSPFAGYAFYLVDDNGNPINVNGDVSTFSDSFKITNPSYIEMLLNGAPNVISPGDKMTEDLELMYELYDPSVKYEVAINSDNTGYWDITKTDSLKDTTYVTNYGGVPTNKDSNQISSSVAYDRTVVWFALKIKNVTNPDTIVVDYGLPVKADVLSNDALFSDDYNLSYLTQGSDFDTALTNAQTQNSDLTLSEYLGSMPVSDTALFTTDKSDGKFGEAVISDNNIMYTMNTENGMQMSEEEVFAYGAYYGGTGAAKTGKGYYYSTLTVIPATSIYYEDNFVSFNVYDHSSGAVVDSSTPHYDELKWTVEGETVSATQAQDRPGDYPLHSLDADNIYGYDASYHTMNAYSLGSARKINVGNHTFADGTSANTRADAKFTFKGTGFDIISLTSNTTGTIVIQVAGKDDVASVNKFYMVDTYYGYKFDSATNQWIVDTEADNALYQIPVMKVEDLPYGKYDVTITVAYSPLFDHQQYGDAQNFDFYLDAIRIYDPANNGINSDVIKDAYIADGEAWPVYEELRNLILMADSFGTSEDNQVVNGAVFIDNTAQGEEACPVIKDYLNYGPNNEVYLAPGQAVAFELDAESAQNVHIAMKSVDNATTSVKIFDASINHAEADVVDVDTATDMYYDITNLVGKTVVIYNCSENADQILSVTNIKTTFDSEPQDVVSVASYFRMSSDIAQSAMESLEDIPVIETTVTETTAPQTTAPQTTAPQTTVPESTTSETSIPETSESTTTELITTETTSSQNGLLGDVNFDGDVNIKDATAIQKHIALLEELDQEALDVADYDLNGNVNIKDATEIQKKIAGLI